MSGEGFSRREREIMDIVYRLREATVADVLSEMADPPSYSSVRALMRVLREKGHLQVREDGKRHVFAPTVPAGRARRSALKNLLTTFFDGSVEAAVASLIDLKDRDLTDQEVERLKLLIENAKQGE